MHQWIKNGARLAWLIITNQQLTWIYRADGTVDKVKGFNQTLSGGDLLSGFQFGLSVLL